jgi:hypothetical protein
MMARATQWIPLHTLGAAALVATMPEPALAQSQAPCSVLDHHPCAPSFCSVFEHGVCMPDYGIPFGDHLRLTVQSRTVTGDGETPKTKLNTIQDVFAALRSCWVPPPMDQSKEGTQITVVFSFTRAGEILGEPRFTFSTPGISVDVKSAYQRAVAAALKRCNPLAFTPKLGGALAGRPFAIRFIDNREFRKPERAT